MSTDNTENIPTNRVLFKVALFPLSIGVIAGMWALLEPSWLRPPQYVRYASVFLMGVGVLFCLLGTGSLLFSKSENAKLIRLVLFIGVFTIAMFLSFIILFPLIFNYVS